MLTKDQVLEILTVEEWSKFKQVALTNWMEVEGYDEAELQRFLGQERIYSGPSKEKSHADSTTKEARPS